MKILKILFVIALIFFVEKVRAQIFTYKQVPSEYSSISIPSNQERVAIKQNLTDLFDITGLLPSGYVKDGSIDYTVFIQNALDKHANVMFPDFPVLINPTGLTIRSNSKVYFPLNSKILLQPSVRKAYEMLRIHNVNNVVLYFPVLIGDRKKHIDTGGEWGMGISIRDSKDIIIRNPKVDDCWGDGIYLGQIAMTNKNIQIIKPFLNNNRRNAISIVAVDGLKIDNAVVANTNGTSPMAGIDFEPDSNNEIVNNISINDPISFNNGFHGILFALSSQSGKVQRDVNIAINNSIDDQSAYGISFKLKQQRFNQGFTPIGMIKINNPTIKNSKVKSLLFYPGNLDNTIKVNISNARIIGNSKVSNSSDQFQKIKRELQTNNKNILLQ